MPRYKVCGGLTTSDWERAMVLRQEGFLVLQGGTEMRDDSFYLERGDAEAAAKNLVPDHYPSMGGSPAYVIAATKFLTEEMQANRR
ncbi:MAG: hypothetical protein SH850_05475 [Planctomycetaceae bacterium]|nr:hypothetical protein [Planctomycetaceae bacterium]